MTNEMNVDKARVGRSLDAGFCARLRAAATPSLSHRRTTRQEVDILWYASFGELITMKHVMALGESGSSTQMCTLRRP